jgi:hypothetical protein
MFRVQTRIFWTDDTEMQSLNRSLEVYSHNWAIKRLFHTIHGFHSSYLTFKLKIKPVFLWSDRLEANFEIKRPLLILSSKQTFFTWSVRSSARQNVRFEWRALFAQLCLLIQELIGTGRKSVALRLNYSRQSSVDVLIDRCAHQISLGNNVDQVLVAKL